MKTKLRPGDTADGSRTHHHDRRPDDAATAKGPNVQPNGLKVQPRIRAGEGKCGLR
jgi:hypothetical protein